MARSFKFSIVRFPAHPLRGERLNLGVVIFMDDHLDVRPAKRLEKLKAISAALNIEDVRDSMLRLATLDQIARTAGSEQVPTRLAQLKEISGFKFSALGEFIAPDADAYEYQIQSLLARLVDPEPAVLSASTKRTTGLLKSVKSALRGERILAKKGEGLDAHRVVVNHQIAEGLRADLLLKNGAMHVIETVDASSDDGVLMRAVKEIAVSALVFEQARMSYGVERTNAQLVYSASSALEKAISPSLLTAEHQGASLLNWDSGDDRRGLLANLARLATPIERGKRDYTIDASAQHKMSLN